MKTMTAPRPVRVDDWWECTVCCFASNSPKSADDHEYETTHMVRPSDD